MDLKTLKQVEKIVNNARDDIKKELSKYVTKDDLKNFATKQDLKQGLDNLFADIVQSVEKGKADKLTVKALEKRVERIEEELTISIS